MARQFLDRVDGVEGVYALTFDDGPSSKWTPTIRDEGQ